MSIQDSISSPQLLSVKNATELIPYSRDYVTRLARDGKVISVLIDRQWFVEKTSLVNFYEQSKIEDSVRARRLSQIRKGELEARESKQARLAVLAQSQSTRLGRTLMQTALILLCGIATGTLLIGIGHTLDQTASLVPASALESNWNKVNLEREYNPFPFDRNEVIETTEKMDLSGGIVLLPTSATTSIATGTVAAFFSDEVSVELTSTTTGVIYNNQTALPFIRVPNTARTKVSPARTDSHSP